MATYAQVLAAKTQGRRQLWYIGGPEDALRQDALELARDHVRSGVGTVATTILFGGDVSGEDVIRRLSEPVPEQRSVIVLLDAEKFQDWDMLLPILPKMPPTDFFIAVSNSHDVDTSLPEVRLFMGKGKSRMIVCKPFTEAQMVLWIEGRLHIQRDATRYLIERSNGDHEWVLNSIRKLEVLGGEITLGAVEALCSISGLPSFFTSLLYYKKRSAIMSLQVNTPSSDVASLLSDSVIKGLLLQDAIRSVGLFSRELGERSHLTHADLTRLKPVLRLYDASNGPRCLGALRRLQKPLSEGNRWAWEALVSRW